MKTKLILLSALLLIGCADETNRQKYLQTKYPKCKVEPATSLIKQGGYHFIVIDSTNQIIAVSFYPFSEKKISNLKNIR